MAADKFSVSVIDLVNYLPMEMKRLAAAVTEFGCFRVVNHGIPTTLIADIRATIRSLFQKPIEVKLHNTEKIISGSGYVAMNAQPDMTQFFESFGIYDAASYEDVQTFCSLLNASPSQREIISEYASKLHSLSMDIASKISDCLGVVDFSFQEWHGLLSLHNYKFTKESIGSVAAVAHTDSSFVTIIQEDGNVGGLEIIGSTGNFETIDPVSDSFFIIVGDMGTVWSNGRLHNVKHRVVCKEGLERFSNVFFLLAPKNYMIQPQAEFIDLQHPKLYDAVNFKEYRRVRQASRSLTGQLLPFLPTS
ncbi:Gibberellin 3-beta-dioxygenase 4 [Dendrobium catenatum]|uniref:Gibberellin 3-beta-dioxygenase 4 n=1 Tax=Dendrobium catenatum TaxID=906689 RepID=A0A2I0WZA3_9ASPA|nr:Gibberellin 3-beta-dioxygenase 4 [Dendrobium catenatum]